MVQPVSSGLEKWYELIKLDTRSTKVQSVANDHIVSKHVKSEEGDYCDKQIQLYAQEDLKVLDCSIYSYAQGAFDYAVWPVKIMGEVLYACYDLVGCGFELVSDLSTPRGSTGRILSTAGYFLGFYISLQSSELLCGWLIAKTMERMCDYNSASFFSKKFVMAGAPILLSVPLQVLFVNGCATAGSYALVIVGNSVCKLMSDNPEEKKLIEEWRKAGTAIEESRLAAIEPPKDVLDEDLWGFEIIGSENDVTL